MNQMFDKMELIADVAEALEEIKALGPWKKLFLAVYRAELARTGKRDVAKALALKATKWADDMSKEAA